MKKIKIDIYGLERFKNLNDFFSKVQNNDEFRIIRRKFKTNIEIKSKKLENCTCLIPDIFIHEISKNFYDSEVRLLIIL